VSRARLELPTPWLKVSVSVIRMMLALSH